MYQPSTNIPISKIPEEFNCPITGQMMFNPVSTSDGSVYEEEAISKWLLEHETSPLTGLILNSKKLTAVPEKKRLIDDFLQANPHHNDKRYIPHISFTQGDATMNENLESKLLNYTNKFNEGLLQQKLNNYQELQDLIDDKIAEINKLERRKDGEGVKKARILVAQLNELAKLYDEMEKISKEIKHDKSNITSSVPIHILPEASAQQTTLNQDSTITPKVSSGNFKLLPSKSESPIIHSQSLVIPNKNVMQPLTEDKPITKDTKGDVENQFNYKKFDHILVMPDSAEKYIAELIMLLSLKHRSIEIYQEKPITILIQEKSDLILKYFKEEELLAKNIESMFTKVQSYLKVSNYKSAIETMGSLLKEIRPFDVEEFKELVAKAKKASDSINEQDIILLLGRTGSGKSTTIHFLAGSSMAEKVVDGINHIAPESIKNDLLKEVTTSPHARSETRYIRAIPINFKDSGLDRDGGIVCCDTPGFEDTNGPEVDIANGIGVVEAVRQAKSVRPVVLISNKSIGDRGELIKSLAHLLVGIVSNIKDHLDAFTYIFTKYSDTELKQVYHSLRSIKEHLPAEDKSDTALMALFQSMLDATDDQQAIGLNPVRDKPKKLLQKLTKIKPILHPSEVFQFSITERSKAALREQVVKHQFSIRQAVKNNNYTLVLYKINQLKELVNILKFDFIQNAYDDSVHYIQKNMIEIYQSAVEQLNKSMLDGNTLTVKDIQSYLTKYNILKNAEVLRSDYLGKETISCAALAQTAIFLSNQLISDILKYEIDNEIVKIRLDKIKLLSIPELSEIQIIYQKQCELINVRVQSIHDDIKKALTLNKFDDLAKMINIIFKAMRSLDGHINAKEADQIYSNIQSDICEHLTNLVIEIKQLLNNEITASNKNNLNKVSANIHLLNLAKSTYNLSIHIKAEELNNYYNTSKKEVFIFFQELTKKISQIFEKQKENSFDEIELLMVQVNAIHNIPDISSMTSELYYQTIEELCGFVKRLKDSTESQVREFLNGSTNTNYQKLSRSILILRKTKWLDTFKPGFSAETMQDICDLLLESTQLKKQKAMALNLRIEDPQNIKEVVSIVRLLSEMQPLETGVPELKNIRDEFLNWFYKHMNENFKLILTLFNPKYQFIKNLESSMHEYQNMLSKGRENAQADAIAFLKSNEFELASLLDTINDTDKKLDYIVIEQNNINLQLNSVSNDLQKLNNVDKKYNDLIAPKNDKARKEAQLFIEKHGYESIDKLSSEVEVAQTKLAELKQKITSFENQTKELLSRKDKLEELHLKYKNIIEEKSQKALLDATNILSIKGFNRPEQLSELIEKEKAKLDELIDTRLGTPFSFGEFDIAKAENVISFLKVCDECKIDTENSELARSLFTKQLSNYIGWFQDEMAAHFNQLKQLQVAGESYQDLINKHVNEFSTKLRQLVELKNKAPLLFSRFPEKILEQYKQSLEEFLSHLSEEMMQLQAARNTYALKMKMFLIKALSRFDYFIDGEKYSGLYSRYRDIFFAEVKVTPAILTAVKERDYIFVASELGRFSQLDDPTTKSAIEQIRDCLTRSLRDFIEDTKVKVIMLAGTIDLETVKTIRSIVDSLNKIKEAQHNLSKYLDEITQNELSACIDFVKLSVSTQVTRFLDSIEASIDANNFYESDARMESITQIRSLLGSYCTQDIVNKHESLKNKIEKELDKVVEKYTNIDLKDYPVYPPIEIFEKFQQVSGKDQKYTQALSKIKAGVLEKCRKSLEQARNSTIVIERNPHIREVSVALKFLPRDLKSGLDVELEAAKEEVQARVDENKEGVERLLELEDTTNLQKYIQNNKNDVTSVRYVKEGIIKKIKECKERIEKKLDQESVDGIFQDIKKLSEYKSRLGDSIPLVINYYDQITNRFSTGITQVIKIIIDNISENDDLSTYITSDISTLTEKNIGILIPCVEFRSELLKEQIDNKDLAGLCQAIFADDFIKKLEQMHEKLTIYFDTVNQNYRKGLQDKSSQLLFKTLEKAKRWEVFIAKLIRYLSVLNDKEAHAKKLADILPKIRHYDMVSNIRNLLRESLVFIKDIDLMSARTKISKDRDDFYREININLLMIIESKQLKSHLDSRDFEVEKLMNDCVSVIKGKVLYILKECNELASKKVSTKADYELFNRYYNNLLVINKNIDTLHLIDIRVGEVLKKAEDKIFEKISSIEQTISSTSDFNEIANHIISIKIVAEGIVVFKEKIDAKVDILLNDFKRKHGGQGLAKLGTILNSEATGIGQIILAEHQCFKGYSVHLFNTKTQRHGIEYVLTNIEGTDIDKAKLKTRYEEFSTKYHNLVKAYLTENVDFSRLIASLKMSLVKVKIAEGTVSWRASIKDAIPELLAHIFAFWTLKNAGHYFDAKGVDDQKSYLLQPHAAQVISIFRMLSVDDSASNLKNNLVQIGTGEGKSVTLAATASILALLGFDVSCACYSDYLSERDYKDFQGMFDSLGVLDHVHYGTFNKLCEAVINENGNIRDLVKSLISSDGAQPNSNAKNSKQRPKILLIDEVDVFFSKDFYGNVYTPIASLTDPSINNLTDYIWREKDKITFGLVKRSPQYQACSAKYKKWEFLLEEAVKDMLADLKTYASHNYVVLNDKIGYKEQDGINFNMVYGYKTLFAYYHEHQLGKISEKSLKENVFISINCGNFSYAEIPHNFLHIMGVTGTLKTLSTPEKNIVENVYHIRKNTFSPSVFGANNLIFRENVDIKIENQADYINAIKREIDDRLVGTTAESKRAVLVFFDSKERLMAFYHSPTVASDKDKYLIMTEEVEHNEKSSLIKKATNSGQVTLLTKSFGRGTDFVCRDQVVSANGGTHVIQCFLSAEISEETQIKGRTARQGEQGSYSMVLLENDLERYLIKKEDIDEIKKNGRYYVVLNQKRNIYFEQQYGEDTKFIEQARKEHESAVKFVNALQKNNLEYIKIFLGERNKGATLASRSRTICLMDATGSMSHLLQKAKNTVGTMFERASEVLKEHGISTDSFEMQFAVYRNYNSTSDMLLQSSTWESKPNNLRAFMETIDSEGGWGDEAIEIGLWHVNKESENGSVSQVILIGDAPANSITDVTSKRANKTEAYWRNTRFSAPTFYQTELAKIKTAQIPIHAFFVDRRAERMFKEISSQTNGRCEALDVNSPKGAETLTNLVTEEILRSVGGSDKGNELVEAYRTKFSRAYK